jgi:RNA recognition motif-containing protein
VIIEAFLMRDGDFSQSESMGNRRNVLNDRKTEQFRKLFIGGLSAKTDEDGLKAFFSAWGDIIDVVVMKDKRSGRSRGFGFVTYLNPSSVDEAQFHRPHEIDGKIVETKRAMSREDANNPEAHMTVNKLFVGGLRKEVTSEDMCKYFMRFGNVVECEVVTWRETGESRGFGFVTFDDYDPVDKAVLYKPHLIGSSLSDVKKALSKTLISRLREGQDTGMPISPPLGSPVYNNMPPVIKTPPIQAPPTSLPQNMHPSLIGPGNLNMGQGSSHNQPSYPLYTQFSSPHDYVQQQQGNNTLSTAQICSPDWNNVYLNPWMAMTLCNGVANPLPLQASIIMPNQNYCSPYRTNSDIINTKNSNICGTEANLEQRNNLLTGLIPIGTQDPFLSSTDSLGGYCNPGSPRLATA